MNKIGNERNPLKIAIVGSGPSGFYAAKALIESDPFVEVDMYERLPNPYGLVRSGVAPDHPSTVDDDREGPGESPLDGALDVLRDAFDEDHDRRADDDDDFDDDDEAAEAGA